MTDLQHKQESCVEQERKLSPVLENYLEIIFIEEAREGAARAKSIADTAGVSRCTVTSTLKVLKSMGLVEYEPYSFIHLTEEGRRIGRDLMHRHAVFREFFVHVLHLDESQADAVACEMEHVTPPEVIRRLGQFVLFMRSKDVCRNWQDEYEIEKTQLLKKMGQVWNDMGRLDAREETLELNRKYR